MFPNPFVLEKLTPWINMGKPMERKGKHPSRTSLKAKKARAKRAKMKKHQRRSRKLRR